MIRREARLRREYIYRKSLEGKAKQTYEKKRAIKEAIAEGKPIPTELKGESLALRDQLQYDDDVTLGAAPSSIDDEYANVGVTDPKILLTTSRDPSSRLQKFVSEMRLIFPCSQRVNRGNTVISELVDAAKSNNYTDIVIVHEHRGEPDGLIVSHMPHGPTAYFGLKNVVLRHDLGDKLGNMSEAYPHLIFDNFQSQLGERLKTILTALFPVPKLDSARVLTFCNRADTISFRHHVYKKTGQNAAGNQVELGEVGPRFELSLYQLKLGSVEMKEAENEWVLRPYMNTAKKRKAL